MSTATHTSNQRTSEEPSRSAVTPGARQARTIDDVALLMYMNLRRLGCTDPATLRDELGLSPQSADRAWHHLQDLGLVQESRQAGAYRTVDPEAALMGLFERQKKRMQIHAQELERLQHSAQAIAHRLRPAVLRDTSSVEVQYLRDRHHRTECLVSLNATAQTDAWSMHPGPLPPSEMLATSLELDAELIARGIRVRAVYGHTVASGARARRYLDQLATLGAEVRLAQRVAFDLLLFDSHTALIPSNPFNPTDPILLLHGSQLMATYLAMYEDTWLHATPYSANTSETADDQLTEKHQAVLALMSNGLTDEQIGRRLGISLRTVGRITAEIMAHIGGDGRFQAGVLAAFKGLVSPDLGTGS